MLLMMKLLGYSLTLSICSLHSDLLITLDLDCIMQIFVKLLKNQHNNVTSSFLINKIELINLPLTIMLHFLLIIL